MRPWASVVSIVMRRYGTSEIIRKVAPSSGRRWSHARTMSAQVASGMEGRVPHSRSQPGVLWLCATLVTLQSNPIRKNHYQLLSLFPLHLQARQPLNGPARAGTWRVLEYLPVFLLLILILQLRHLSKFLSLHCDYMVPTCQYLFSHVPTFIWASTFLKCYSGDYFYICIFVHLFYYPCA